MSSKVGVLKSIYFQHETCTISNGFFGEVNLEAYPMVTQKIYKTLLVSSSEIEIITRFIDGIFTAKTYDLPATLRDGSKGS